MSSDNTDSKRYANGFISVASSLEAATKKILGKNGFVELDIILNWPEIAGEKLAEFTHPQSLDFKSGERSNGILTVCVESGAFALEINHKKNLIIEKINVYFGYNAVKDLRTIQMQDNSFGKHDDVPSTREKKNLVTFQEQNYIVEQTADIEHENLQQSLQILGKNIFEQDKKNEN